VKPFIWRGKQFGNWYVDTTKANPDTLPGTSPHGYLTWREAYDATRHAIASNPA